METFTPISMKCTQKQFDAVEPKLRGLEIASISPFSDYNYLVNNLWGELKLISNIPYNYNGSHNRKVYEEWNEETFLKACGIKKETLQEKDIRLENELKEVKKQIEEENNPKIGEFVIFSSSDYKYIGRFLGDHHHYDEILKITNPKLIKLLEQEIK